VKEFTRNQRTYRSATFIYKDADGHEYEYLQEIIC